MNIGATLRVSVSFHCAVFSVPAPARETVDRHAACGATVVSDVVGVTDAICDASAVSFPSQLISAVASDVITTSEKHE